MSETCEANLNEFREAMADLGVPIVLTDVDGNRIDPGDWDPDVHVLEATPRFPAALSFKPASDLHHAKLQALIANIGGGQFGFLPYTRIRLAAVGDLPRILRRLRELKVAGGVPGLELFGTAKG